MAYEHQSQYQAGASAITRTSGCTWTSGATGVGAVTGGRYAPEPDDIHDLLRRDEETAPTTPGWSLPDLEKALGRYGMGFDEHTGTGWEGVRAQLVAYKYVVLQGDSDQFPAGCSGAFDGDHAIGVHPRTKVERGVRYWWINDPICPEGRWERETILRRYAAKLWANIRFGAFTQPVPVSYRVEIPKGETIYVFLVRDGKVVRARKIVTQRVICRRCSKPRTYPWLQHDPVGLVKLDNDGPYLNARWHVVVFP